jgi:hypothetical protein
MLEAFNVSYEKLLLLKNRQENFFEHFSFKLMSGTSSYLPYSSSYKHRAQEKISNNSKQTKMVQFELRGKKPYMFLIFLGFSIVLGFSIRIFCCIIFGIGVGIIVVILSLKSGWKN